MLVVQDVMFTATAAMADVVLPAAAGAFESEGTVTSSERRVQRVRRTKAPAGESRDDLDIIFAMARHMGADWGPPDAERVWNELRALSPVHAGMSYARLEREGGLQWPCYDESHPGEIFLHSRLWERPVLRPARAVLASWSTRCRSRRSTTSTRCGSRPAGGWRSTTPACRPAATQSPLRRGETIDVSPEDAARLGFREGQPVRVALAARRGRRAACTSTRRCDPASPS